MNFNSITSRLLKEEESKSLTKSYVDDKIKELEDKLKDIGAGGKYNVIPSHVEGRLAIIDIDKGSIIGNISPRGKLISVPVVFNDRVSFAVQDDNDATLGTVHSLPEGTLINQFRVGPPRPGTKYKVVMGREEDKEKDEDPLPIEPEEEDEMKEKEVEDVLDDLEKKKEDEEEPVRVYDDPGDVRSDVSQYLSALRRDTPGDLGDTGTPRPTTIKR